MQVFRSHFFHVHLELGELLFPRSRKVIFAVSFADLIEQTVEIILQQLLLVFVGVNRQVSQYDRFNHRLFRIVHVFSVHLSQRKHLEEGIYYYHFLLAFWLEDQERVSDCGLEFLT